MSAAVLPFTSRADRQSKIPMPVFYLPGDVYARVEFLDDSCANVGLHPGAVAVFLRGFRQDNLLHLFTLGGERLISRLERHGRHVLYGVDLEQGEYLPVPEVGVYGALAELYPGGLTGPRLVTHRTDRVARGGMEFPLINVAAAL